MEAGRSRVQGQPGIQGKKGREQKVLARLILCEGFKKKMHSGF
jgi:hypothetical protein